MTFRPASHLHVASSRERLASTSARLLAAISIFLTLTACERLTARDFLKDLADPDTAKTETQKELNCEEIYAEMYRLFPQTYSSARHSFFDDDRNAGFLFTGLMFEPLFLGLGYTAVTNFTAEQRVARTELEIEALRRESARHGCWLR